MSLCCSFEVITAIQKSQSEKVANIEQRVEQLEDDVAELRSLRAQDADRVESLFLRQLGVEWMLNSKVFKDWYSMLHQDKPAPE